MVTIWQHTEERQKVGKHIETLMRPKAYSISTLCLYSSSRGKCFDLHRVLSTNSTECSLPINSFWQKMSSMWCLLSVL